MKKFFTVLIAVIMAISVFAFSACGKGGNSKEAKGSIDGKYEKVDPETDAESYAAIAEKLENVKPAPADAEKAGGDAKANVEIKMTVDGKSLTLSLDAALALILDIAKIYDGMDSVSGMAINLDLGLKADKGFGAKLIELSEKIEAEETDEDTVVVENEQTMAMLALIDDFNIKLATNGYVKDSKIYADAKADGIPDNIKALGHFDQLIEGYKITFTEDEMEDIISGLIGAMFGGNNDDEASLQSAAPADNGEDSYGADLSGYLNILANFGIEISAELSDNGLKLKLATTDTTKTVVAQMLPLMLGESVHPEVLNTLVFSKLDVELYVAIDANGVLQQIAANVDVAISATVAEMAIGVAVSGAFDCSLIVPTSIDYPSFEGYVNPLEGQQAA